MKITQLWCVIDPTNLSELGDVCFKLEGIKDIVHYILGASQLKPDLLDRHPAFYTDGVEALADVRARLPQTQPCPLFKMGTQEVFKVTILHTSNTDRVIFTLSPNAPSPFPEMHQQHPGDYPAHISMEVRHGYAEEWLAKTFGLRPDDCEIITDGLAVKGRHT